MSQAKMSREVKPENLTLNGENMQGNGGTAVRSHTERRANDLDGATWTRYSISVWNDIRKSPEEARLGHPAMFPLALVTRLIDCLTTGLDRTVLDPFMGSGSTLLGAEQRHKVGIGFEISDDYVQLAKSRLSQGGLFTNSTSEHRIFREDARHLLNFLRKDSIDLCITSPPYWDILSQKRTADYKTIRDYGDVVQDLAKISAYDAFLDVLTEIFKLVLEAMRPGKYCVVNVMDLRKKERFFPFHSDLASRMVAAGWIFDDLIIWDRRQEYNNLRPLGYPAVFRINKIHEYLLIFKKPTGAPNDHHGELPRP